MKKLIVFALMLTFALSAFAATGSGKVNVISSGLIAGQQLAAGEYKMVWTGEGEQVQVQIMKGKNTLITAPAKVVEREFKALNDAVLTSEGKIKEVRFSGKKTTLVFEQ
ncbi:MAG TPA: hypothetical protein VD837_04560 [Terriglobales bacterium]|nr:hypothetical protein [Terriglobales bacterium]